MPILPVGEIQYCHKYCSKEKQTQLDLQKETKRLERNKLQNTATINLKKQNQ
jgi:hypothetical protein